MVNRTKQQEGYPRLYVFEAYQVAALQLLAEQGGSRGDKARIIIDERYSFNYSPQQPPRGFPDPQEHIGVKTFFTALANRPELRNEIWPDEPQDDFRKYFRRREQRRELISALARLGIAYIDLYLLALKQIGSFDASVQSRQPKPVETLAENYLDLLEKQRQEKEQCCNAFYELSQAAKAFDVILSVNFPDIADASLTAVATHYGRTLQRQVPVGRMAGEVNRRLIRQFRMPGFPLVLATTDVLQEGEDLHTFCRRVVHYGITWTPSAMEQRTGRIDRIGSMVQRRLDGREMGPEQDELIQVYFPHLTDTVEVFQVKRVLERLNKFLELIHKPRADKQVDESRINVPREMLYGGDYLPQIAGVLDSAFPVRSDWLKGVAGQENVCRPDLSSLERFFQENWNRLRREYAIEEIAKTERSFTGNAYLKDCKLLRLNQESSIVDPDRHAFCLELRSQVIGSEVLLRCISEVGLMHLDIKAFDDLDALYEWEKRMDRVKVCIQHDARQAQFKVSLEKDRLFRIDTTQPEEVEELVVSTVEMAELFKKELIEKIDTGWKPQHQKQGDIGEIDPLVRAVCRNHANWHHDGRYIDSDLPKSGRKQRIHIEIQGGECVFWSTILGSKTLTQNVHEWNRNVLLAWQRNTEHDLVTFAFDKTDRLVGVVRHPLVHLDAEEVEQYITVLTRECDRFEYLLTGGDKF